MNEICLTVDRIEEGIAVCEMQSGALVHVLASKMPRGVRDGDRVRLENGVWRLLTEETEALREEIFALAESLFDE